MRQRRVHTKFTSAHYINKKGWKPIEAKYESMSMVIMGIIMAVFIHFSFSVVKTVYSINWGLEKVQIKYLFVFNRKWKKIMSIEHQITIFIQSFSQKLKEKNTKNIQDVFLMIKFGEQFMKTK